MGKRSDTIIVVDSDSTEKPIPENNKTTADNAGARKKGGAGAAHLLKAASFILRRSKKPKPSQVDVASNPLHVDSNNSSPRPSIEAVRSPSLSPPMVEHDFEEVCLSPMSQAGESSSSCSEASTSRFASAVNLQELERKELVDGDAAYEECGGDEMNIDAKAEQFIAQFYEQIRLQRVESFNRRYHEMIERSIG